MSWLRFARRGRHEEAGAPRRALSEELTLKKENSDFPHDSTREYWPVSVVRDAISEEAVRREFSKARKEKCSSELCTFIVKDAPMLFVLVTTTILENPDKQIRVMKWFRKNGIQDSTLSTVVENSGTSAGSWPWLVRERLRDDQDPNLWTEALASLICDNQWKVLVPIFSTQKDNYNLGEKTVFPFTKCTNSHHATGAFGMVTKVKIHAGHFIDDTPVVPAHESGLADNAGPQPYNWPEFFAVKEILAPNQKERLRIEENFAKEAGSLRTMNGHYCKHILRFATAFTKGNDATSRRYFLIFEWANGGSLEDLFMTHNKPTLSKKLVMQVAEQILGVASALKTTHEKAKIRHGDLKPGNILWFKPARTNSASRKTGGNHGTGGERHEQSEDSWDDEEDFLGTLKIGDWGLAKYHVQSTEWRGREGLGTATEYGTPLYEPPEVELGKLKILGRQYDVWSMGCIILEILIWLLYGYDGVQAFRKDVNGRSGTPQACYVTETDNESQTIQNKARVRPIVNDWMDHLANEPLCSPKMAMGALLQLVRQNLLVVELPPQGAETKYGGDWEEPPIRDADLSPTSSPAPGLLVTAPTSNDGNFGRPKPRQRNYRLTSGQLVDRLSAGILDEDNPDDWWFAPTKRGTFPNFGTNISSNSSGLLPGGGRPGGHGNPMVMTGARCVESPIPPTLGIPGPVGSLQPARVPGGPSAGHLSIVREFLNYEHPTLNNEWEIHLDNKFATEVLSRLRDSPDFRQPRLDPPSALCATCQKYAFFDVMGFQAEFDPKDLESRANRDCGLCTLFWKTAQRYGMAYQGVRIRFYKQRSWLNMDGVGSPVLTICRSLDSESKPNIQLGLPRLPVSGSPAHFEIMRQWLQLCDQRNVHPVCQPSTSATSATKMPVMPARLLDVGQDGDELIYLWEPTRRDTSDYVALSHPWGLGPHFITNIHNLKQHKAGIRIASLPATFRDAVTTTRALGKRHLWIDSICIIQGPGGDFQEQAKSMETVFSSAYCVLAASRAHTQTDGFLGPRRDRDYVALIERPGGAPFYICENIDNFDGDVLSGHFSQRGWVLQEHALARRTIFFTDLQTYWECGDGVRCESLTKMSNYLAAFLGDPSFPRIIMNASQGERIIRLQNLFRTYSSLTLTNPTDRPFAVDGIQRRLLKAFETQGGFGIFGQDEDDAGTGRVNRGQKGLLRRSLLWYRPSEKEGLTEIEFPNGMEVPSWSWMAYLGGIDLLRPEFGMVEWMKLRSPWPGRRHSRGDSLGMPESPDAKADSDGPPVIKGRIREILQGAREEGPGKKLFFDAGGEVGETIKVQCLVLGVEKKKPVEEARHYFIMVEPAMGRYGLRVMNVEETGYRRIGAGYLPGRYISEEGHDGQIW